MNISPARISVPKITSRMPRTPSMLRAMRRPQAMKRSRSRNQSARSMLLDSRGQGTGRMAVGAVGAFGKAEEEVLERLVAAVLAELTAHLRERSVQELFTLMEHQHRCAKVLDQRKQMRADDDRSALGGVFAD